MSDEQKLHLQFIQGVISRMNSNSVSMKGWMVAILSAMLAVFACTGGDNPYFLVAAILPTLLFWLFDTYYLKMERQYRLLYNKVVKQDASVKLFSMDANQENVSFWETFKCPIEIGIYLPIIVLLVVGAVLIMIL